MLQECLQSTGNGDGYHLGRVRDRDRGRVRDRDRGRVRDRDRGRVRDRDMDRGRVWDNCNPSWIPSPKSLAATWPTP